DVHLAPVGADEDALALSGGADGTHGSPALERAGSNKSAPPRPAGAGDPRARNWPPGHPETPAGSIIRRASGGRPADRYRSAGRGSPPSRSRPVTVSAKDPAL